MADASVAEVTIDLIVEGQPECCKKLHANGWRFSYCRETRFVTAEHPLGGKQSVVEVYSVGRSGFDVNELGNAIAMMLNGGNHER
jgi:hypothetical protein